MVVGGKEGERMRGWRGKQVQRCGGSETRTREPRLQLIGLQSQGSI